jgi:hypothetical protein
MPSSCAFSVRGPRAIWTSPSGRWTSTGPSVLPSSWTSCARRPVFFTFIVGEVMSTLDQAPDGGARFPIDARVDGRTFVAFHVDLGVGDQLLEPLEDLVGRDWLGFAGIAPGTARAVSVEQQCGACQRL